MVLQKGRPMSDWQSRITVNPNSAADDRAYVGCAFAYVMFWRVVAIAGATTAASVTYIVPIVATVLGIVVLGEQLLWHEPVGAVIVLGGVWLSQQKSRKQLA